MSKNSNPSSPKAAAKVMLATLWSTTWRIFSPVTILFIVGFVIDLNAASKPWGMAIGTALGVAIAIVLVLAQLKDIRQNPIIIEGDK